MHAEGAQAVLVHVCVSTHAWARRHNTAARQEVMQACKRANTAASWQEEAGGMGLGRVSVATPMVRGLLTGMRNTDAFVDFSRFP